MSAKKQFTLASGCFNLNEWFDTDCISIAVADSASVAMRWWKNITTVHIMDNYFVVQCLLSLMV